MLLGTGLRWGELAGAHIEHYDPKTATYRVTKVHDDHSRELRDYPKGKKRRTVPIPPWVQKELTKVIGKRRSGLIFTTTTGTALDNGNFVKRTLTPALLHTGIEDVTPHTFRHTYASWLIQEGVSLAEVGKLLGHVSPQTTARYTHLLQEASQQVIDALADPWGSTENDTEIGQVRGANVGQIRATRRSATLRHSNRRKPRLPSNSKEIGA
ncbi:Integrase [Agrococcus casei LMG 22410]|uniref:Integrase n=2 Tax=Agrococcus TaxID=46352 RepID=A0A1R4FEE0_9MICO|nr:Integrase [Agrococcus casei LMG 22410]